MRKEHVGLVGKDVAEPDMRFVILKLDLHQCRMTQRVTLFPDQSRWDVYLISSIYNVSAIHQAYADGRTLRDGPNAASVYHFFEPSPSDSTSTHRTWLSIGVQRKVFPRLQDPLRRPASLTENIGTMPYRGDFSMHCWIWDCQTILPCMAYLLLFLQHLQ
jgi:hypothetical protein